MLHKEIAYHKIYMRCESVNPTSYTLPAGYTLRPYVQGNEEDWCRIQVESGHVSSLPDAVKIFQADFAKEKDRCATYLLFVYNEEHKAIGTIALWNGKTGFPQNRLHWLGVCDGYDGLGIATYLVQEACRLANGPIYLDSQTWSFPAIHIYQKFGFQRWDPTQAEDYKEAWKIIDECLQENRN